MTLADYISSNLKTAFEWGRFDCVLFAARWIELRTGSDPLAGLPKWKTERHARRVIKAVGGLEQALDERFPRTCANLAKDGDLALFDNRVCLFSGSHIVGPGAEGLIFIDRTNAECAWSY